MGLGADSFGKIFVGAGLVVSGQVKNAIILWKNHLKYKNSQKPRNLPTLTEKLVFKIPSWNF